MLKPAPSAPGMGRHVGDSCNRCTGDCCVPSVHTATCAVHTSDYDYYKRDTAIRHAHSTAYDPQLDSHHNRLTVFAVAGAQTYGCHCVRYFVFWLDSLRVMHRSTAVCQDLAGGGLGRRRGGGGQARGPARRRQRPRRGSLCRKDNVVSTYGLTGIQPLPQDSDPPPVTATRAHCPASASPGIRSRCVCEGVCGCGGFDTAPPTRQVVEIHCEHSEHAEENR